MENLPIPTAENKKFYAFLIELRALLANEDYIYFQPGAEPDLLATLLTKPMPVNPFLNTV